jgi:hypothetical protein
MHPTSCRGRIAGASRVSSFLRPPLERGRGGFALVFTLLFSLSFGFSPSESRKDRCNDAAGARMGGFLRIEFSNDNHNRSF